MTGTKYQFEQVLTPLSEAEFSDEDDKHELKLKDTDKHHKQ
jgi:hypothetical protein